MRFECFARNSRNWNSSGVTFDQHQHIRKWEEFSSKYVHSFRKVCTFLLKWKLRLLFLVTAGGLPRFAIAPPTADPFFGSFFLSYQCRQDITYEPVCKQEVQQSIQGHHWCRLVRYLPYLSRAQTLPTPSFHLQPYQGSHGRRQASNHAGQLEHLIHIKCPLTLRLIVHSLFTCQLGPISYHRNSHRNLH